MGKRETACCSGEIRLLGPALLFQPHVYRCINNPNTSLQEMLQKRLIGPPSREGSLRPSLDNPNVKAGKVVLESFTIIRYRYLGYNRRGFVQGQARRGWAIGHAIPVDEIIQKIYHGLAERITGPFLPGSPGDDTSLKAGRSSTCDKARSLLDEAGWKVPEGESCATSDRRQERAGRCSI